MRRKLAGCAMWAAAAAVLLGAASCAAVRAAKPDFRKMDVNRDGKVTEGEFDAYVAACPECGLKKTVFTAWDRNQDGMVTFEEFQLVQPIQQEEAPAAKEKE